MSKVRIKLNSQGVRELLKSQEMMNACSLIAEKAYSRLGDGYSLKRHVGLNRVNVSIGTESAKSVKENYENNTILKALGGASKW